MALKTPNNLGDLPAFLAEHFTTKDINRIPAILTTHVEPLVRRRLGWSAGNEQLVIRECGNVISRTAGILLTSKDARRRALGHKLRNWGE